MRERVDALVALSMLAATVMLAGGLMSLVSFVEYVGDGEMAVNNAAVPCIVMGAIFLVVFLVITVPVARVLLSSPSVGARRASYFSVLFPVLLVSFLLSSPQASFAPTFAFAWPLMLLGAVAYPYSAFTMRRWLRAAEMENLLLLECFRCTYTFEMHRLEPCIRCPYCGQVNMNPTMGEGKPAPPGEAPREEGVSP